MSRGWMGARGEFDAGDGDSEENVNREYWLNGWKRNGSSVLLINTSHCAGCGRLRGVFTVALSENDVFPEKSPDWPFELGTCPICSLFDEIKDKPDTPRGSFKTFENKIKKQD